MGKRFWFRLLIVGTLWVALSFQLLGQTEALGATQNRETNNLNVLFIGFAEERLEMISIYSINHQDQMQSGAVFIPVQALLPDENLSFREYYQKHGLNSLKEKLADQLAIRIAYHVVVKNSIMDEVEKMIGIITVAGEQIDLKELFTMAPTPQDELILGELVQRLTRPEIYFWHLPRLCLVAQRHIATDFPLTVENLWLHYRIASQIPTDRIQKIILPFQQLSLTDLSNAIYNITR